ncbi:NADH-quinone oxidoreductase subunit F [Tritrichomonas foetus]|uniref:NADH-quinone oxidoreductase subunit F n=1 Tax=Tritrichomonas foetus TaxID=1144522 RepID=A0A1J4KA89_9EUKA|nr:NADH-quinone oxidoreductase subunit F [Tritrichomonas foetus]|eukprot:OHT08353.1 NADH-quinone oxidoreductase subunit F [Tritrichomonas foetus]
MNKYKLNIELNHFELLSNLTDLLFFQMLSSFGKRFDSKGAKPLDPKDLIYTNLYGQFGVDLESSRKRGDWVDTEKLLAKGRDWIIDQVKKSEIRGRGGAGFATGTKMSYLPKKVGKKPHYLVINGDEGEPGTCKDRQVLLNEPHKIIEGALLTSYAIQAHTCYAYIRGEFRYEIQRLQKAIDEAYKEKLIGKNNKFGWDFDVHIFSGAGAYVCGEETALLNSISGLPGHPRYKPPYPSKAGLFNAPTLVNNVETISSIPAICRRGGEWYSSIGVPGSKGTKIYCISGNVNNPCVVEEAMGVPIKYLIEKYGGGVIGGWDNLLGVFPGGMSCKMLTAEEASEAIMSFDDLEEYDSAFGTGALIVLDKSVDLLGTFARVAKFYEKESCGQCEPCRSGTARIADIIERLSNGTGKKKDIKLLEQAAKKNNPCCCGLAPAGADPIKGLLRHYRKEVEKLVKD